MLSLIRQHYQDQKLSGLCLTNLTTIKHLTGFSGSFARVLITETRAIFFTDARYIDGLGALDLESQGFETKLFRREETPAIKLTKTAKVGIEPELELGQRAPLEKWLNTSTQILNPGLGQLRRSKTAEEVQKIQTAQTRVDQKLVPTLQKLLKTGLTEAELAFSLEVILRENGQFDLSFPVIVAFGENSAIPHHTPRNRALKPSENILIDCGLQYQGYCSDMTRNFIWGEPEKAYVKDYYQLCSIQKTALSQVKTGAQADQIDQTVRESLGENAEFYTHSLGHGVGLEIHEAPSLHYQNQVTLQANEVITIEPGIYFPQRYGIRIEDLVLVGNPSEILSQTSKQLLSFPIDGGEPIAVKAVK